MRRKLNQYNSESFPDDPDLLPPARRRRARRLLAPLEADERADFLDEVAHRASPSFDFFLFSLLAGVVFGAGFLLDSNPLLLLGALIAPVMAPAIGVALGTVIGSLKFFMRSLVGLLIGSFLVFGTGLLVGYAALNWPGLQLDQVQFHARLSWDNFLVLALGTIFTAMTMVRSSRAALLPSVALAYELYPPLAAAGIGFTSGIPFLWPDGVVVFTIHLAWAAFLGAITLAVLGFRPLTLFGYTLGGVVALAGVILLIGLGGFGAAFGAQIALPTSTPTPTSTITPTPTSTHTPIPPSGTPTPPPTPTPSRTPSPTPTQTPTPTPILAIIQVGTAEAAHVRSEPGFQATSIALLPNGAIVEVLPEEPIFEGGANWVLVMIPDGQQGWIVETLLATPTPTP